MKKESCEMKPIKRDKREISVNINLPNPCLPSNPMQVTNE